MNLIRTDAFKMGDQITFFGSHISNNVDTHYTLYYNISDMSYLLDSRIKKDTDRLFEVESYFSTDKNPEHIEDAVISLLAILEPPSFKLR